MSTTPQPWRTLGLSAPIAEALDAKLWRRRFAWGLMIGPEESREAEPSLADLLLKPCAKPTTAATTQQEELNAAVTGIPDDVIRWHLRVGLGELEAQLGVPMGVIVHKAPPIDDGLSLGSGYDRLYPRMTYTASAVRDDFQIILPSPVISVERVRLYWQDIPVWEAPEGSIKVVHAKHGLVHVQPTGMVDFPLESLGQMTASGWAPRSPMPNALAVDWTAGPITEYGQPGDLEVVLINLVYAIAGLTLLSMDGLARSKGFTSKSLSIDGLSKSVSFQASLNAALEDRYQKTLERIPMDKIRTHKRGLRIYPYGY